MTKFTLAGQGAIVTGGGKGIGRAIAMRLAQEGAAVAICGREAGAIEATVAEIAETGGRALGRTLDVSDTDAVNAFVAETQATFGRLDVLVNNAALTAMSNIGFAPVPDLPVDEWRQVVDVNLSSAFFEIGRASCRERV